VTNTLYQIISFISFRWIHINYVAENLFRSDYNGYANETLYDFAIVFYVLLFFIQLIKKKYKVFQMIVFILNK